MHGTVDHSRGRILFGLSQGGEFKIGILLLMAPTGKADLPRMVVEMVGALSEEDGGSGGVGHQGNQYGSGTRIPAGLHIRIEGVIPCATVTISLVRDGGWLIEPLLNQFSPLLDWSVVHLLLN